MCTSGLIINMLISSFEDSVDEFRPTKLRNSEAPMYKLKDMDRKSDFSMETNSWNDIGARHLVGELATVVAAGGVRKGDVRDSLCRAAFAQSLSFRFRGAGFVVSAGCAADSRGKWIAGNHCSSFLRRSLTRLQ